MIVPFGTDGLTDRLLDQRIITISGRLTVEEANRVVASLALLDASGDDPIQLRFLDVSPKPGTELDAVLTLLDAIDLVGVPIEATCLGGLRGVAVTLLAVADRRRAGANAVLILEEPHSRFGGSAAEIAARAEQFQRQLGVVQQRLASACRRPTDSVVEDMRSGRVLGAEAAREYGLIDEVVSPSHPR